MATTKKRINVSVSKEVDELLEKLAERDQVPQATKAEALIRLALEIEEDQVLDRIASARDTSSSTFISHDEAWR